jgi:hypothetical protein
MSAVARKLWVVINVTTILTLSVYAVWMIQLSSSKPVYAQEDDATLRGLLYAYNQQASEDPSFSYFVAFAQPIYGDVSVIQVGALEEGPPRVVDQIGEDHFCILEGAGSSNALRCIPYTNVISVTTILEIAP